MLYTFYTFYTVNTIDTFSHYVYTSYTFLHLYPPFYFPTFFIQHRFTEKKLTLKHSDVLR